MPNPTMAIRRVARGVWYRGNHRRLHKCEPIVVRTERAPIRGMLRMWRQCEICERPMKYRDVVI
jgi:hypothetical protein